MLKEERIKKDAYQRKIHIERFPSLTSENIVSILNKMDSDEIYFWVYIQKEYNLISRTIEQVYPGDELMKIFNEKNKNVNYDYFKNQLLLKMLEVDSEEGLRNEVDVIL